MSGELHAHKLFAALTAFFAVNAVLAEFIGVKIFALEDKLGMKALELADGIVPCGWYTQPRVQDGRGHDQAARTTTAAAQD